MEEVGLAPPAPHPLDRPPMIDATGGGDGGGGGAVGAGTDRTTNSFPQDDSTTAITTESSVTGSSMTDSKTKDSKSDATDGGAFAAATATTGIDRCAGCNASNVPLLACDGNNLLDPKSGDREQNQQQQEQQTERQR